MSLHLKIVLMGGVMAVALFPLCDDETLDSNIGRYAKFFRLKSTRWLRGQLFGYVGKPGIKLPNSISRLAEQTEDYWGLSAEEIVKEHTEYWYATRVASSAMRDEILRTMLQPPEPGSLGRLSAYRMRGDRITGLRYCEECLAQWRANGTEPYWKVSHQLPGVYFCEVHMVALKVVAQSIEEINLDPTVVRRNGALDLTIIQSTSQSERAAAMDVVRLSVERTVPNEDIPLMQKYYDLLRHGGFLRPDSTINRNTLVYEWLDYYGSEYCFLAGINSRRILAWSFNIGWRARRDHYVYPFMYVAAESFLRNRLSSRGSFLPAPRRKLIPVKGGESILPCLDLPPCAGVLHEDNDSCTVSGHLIRSGGWKVVCSCGISYRVLDVFPGEAVEMAPFAYGSRYRKGFDELLARGLSPKKAARELHISNTTGMSWAHGGKSQGHESISVSISEIKKMRAEWRHLVGDASPEMRITSAQRENPDLYEMLRKNDYAWFVKFNRRHRSWRSAALFHVNGIDVEGGKARSAWSEIMQMEPPVRATRSAILDKAGLPLHLASEANARSPLWAELAETRDAHRERVILWIGSLSKNRRLPRGNVAINEIIRGTGLNMRSFTAEQKARIRQFISNSQVTACK
ncbi:TnsD family Tn7-like transposition protein [Burkholderia ubonensis]|uniref:TnsD family Tn7-like transposition protein n=1 Tax=Burkholderia ubonensis TaxID=101571 RepID=UPI000A43C83E|nr:TnsD family Tn7-like transposition protein [Burkholderia ubonensis]